MQNMQPREQMQSVPSCASSFDYSGSFDRRCTTSKTRLINQIGSMAFRSLLLQFICCISSGGSLLAVAVVLLSLSLRADITEQAEMKPQRACSRSHRRAKYHVHVGVYLRLLYV